jgi:hypothetical protein
MKPTNPRRPEQRGQRRQVVDLISGRLLGVDNKVSVMTSAGFSHLPLPIFRTEKAQANGVGTLPNARLFQCSSGESGQPQLQHMNNT